MKQTDFAELLTQALDLRGLSAADFAGGFKAERPFC